MYAGMPVNMFASVICEHLSVTKSVCLSIRLDVDLGLNAFLGYIVNLGLLRIQVFLCK